MKTFTPKLPIGKLLLALILCLAFFSPTLITAQITIEENIFTDYIGKKYKEVLYETDLNIDNQFTEILNAIGPDQVYDFSDFNYIDSTVIIYEVNLVDPNDPLLMNPELANSEYIIKVMLLPGSGGVEDTTINYQYSSLEDGIWTINGSITLIDIDFDGSLDSVLQFFTPANLQVPFPVTSTSEWYDSTSLISIFMGMEFVSSTFIDSNWVEGYGTLITPFGTAEALRVHNKQITKVPGSPFVDVSNDYDFVIASDEFNGTIVLEDGRAFYSVRSLLGGSTATKDLRNLKFVTLNIAPNPFSNILNVNLNMLEAGTVEFSLIGVSGNEILSKRQELMPIGINNISLQISDIPQGLYYLQIRSGNFIQHSMVNKI